MSLEIDFFYIVSVIMSSLFKSIDRWIRKNRDPYRLPSHVLPTIYDLEIEPISPEYTHFRGKCSITLNFTMLSNYFSIHAIELNFHYITIDGSQELIANIDHHISSDRIFIELKKEMSEEHVLMIEYTGKINSTMNGLYKSIFQGKTVLMSHFEPTSARRCFPCLDEPAFKAKFNLKIIVPKEYLVLSNMPLLSKNVGTNKTIHQFSTTPIMSTYLLAFFIGYADFIEERSTSGILIRVYSSQHKKHSTFALKTVLRALVFMENYFGISFPLPKLDFIAYPDLAAGAMEHWGMISFREENLLCTQNTTHSEKINIAYVICHELAHQWFGNYVTMAWWNDIWLNESFATCFGWYVADKLFPEWRILEAQYLYEITRSLSADSLKSTHSINVYIRNTSDIHEAFNTISYSKGSAILRMLMDLIGEELFQKSIRVYLETHAYSNTTASDLWHIFDRITRTDITSFMTPWIKIAGYPVIIIQECYDGYQLTQEQFLLNCVYPTIWYHGKRWPIPINETVLNPNDSPIITSLTNMNQGFYRCFYTTKNLLKTYIQTDLSIYDALKVMDDQLNLLRSCSIPWEYYTYAFSLLVINHPEIFTDCYFWELLQEHYRFFRLIDLSVAEKFYKLISPTFSITENNCYEEIDDLRCAIIFRIECLHGNPIVVSKCRKSLEKFLENPEKPPYQLKSMVEAVLMYDTDLEEIIPPIITLMEKDVSLQTSLITSIGLCREAYLLPLFPSKFKKQNKFAVFIGALQNPIHSRQIMEMIIADWDFIYDNYKEEHFELRNLINAMIYTLKSREQINELEEFMRNREKKNIERTYLNLIEKAKINQRTREFLVLH